MAVKISNIEISSQEVTVGSIITITITAVDVSWEIIKDDFTSWNEINTELSNWRSVLNHY